MVGRSTSSPNDFRRLRRRGSDAPRRAPLYSRLSAARRRRSPTSSRLLARTLPRPQQLPVLLFAAVHYLLLAGDGPELAAHYPNLSATPRRRRPARRCSATFVLDHAGRDRRRHRHAQHADQRGRAAARSSCRRSGCSPTRSGTLAHVDVGTSAGLNLLLPRYRYGYEPGGVDPAQPSDGARPLLDRVVDGTRRPCRPDDADDRPVHRPRPGTDRRARRRGGPLAGGVRVARPGRPLRTACVAADRARPRRPTRRPPGRRRRATSRAVVAEAAEHGHPVVTEQLGAELPARRRSGSAYVAELDRLGAERDLSWVIAESPAQTPGLPVPTTDPPEDITVVSLVRWRAG